MKTFLIAAVACSLAICSGETPVSGPYPPSGWKPDGPAFELPTDTQFQGFSKFTVQENNGAYLPPSQKSQGQGFSSPNNEYGAPDSFDLSVQGLPGKETESTFRKSLLQSGADKPYVNTFTKELRQQEEEKRKQAEQQNVYLNTAEQYNFESDKQRPNSAQKNFEFTYQPSAGFSVQNSAYFNSRQQFSQPQNQQQHFDYSAPQNLNQGSYPNVPAVSKNQYDANLYDNQKNNFQNSQPQQGNDFQYYQQQQNNFQSYDAPQVQTSSQSNEPQEPNSFQNYQPQEQYKFQNYQPQEQNTFQNYQPQEQNNLQSYQTPQQNGYQNYKTPQQIFQNTQDFQKTQGNSFQNYQTPQQNDVQNIQTFDQRANFNSRIQPQKTFQNQKSFDKQNNFQNTQNFRGDNQQEYGQPQNQQFSQNQASDDFKSGDQGQSFGVQAGFDSRRGPTVSVTGFSSNQETPNQFSEYGVPRTVPEYGPPKTRSTSPSPVDDAYTTESSSLGVDETSTDYNFGPNVAISTSVSDGRGRRGSARLRNRRGQSCKTCKI